VNLIFIKKLLIKLTKWAKQVLCIEQNVPIKERLKHQAKYASILDNGKKAFIVRWKITVRNLEIN
jgi:hypothetical protein